MEASVITEHNLSRLKGFKMYATKEGRPSLELAGSDPSTEGGPLKAPRRRGGVRDPASPSGVGPGSASTRSFVADIGEPMKIFVGLIVTVSFVNFDGGATAAVLPSFQRNCEGQENYDPDFPCLTRGAAFCGTIFRLPRGGLDLGARERQVHHRAGAG